MGKKIVIFMLCLSIVLTSSLSYAIESLGNHERIEKYEDEELGILLERKIDANGVVTVLAKELDTLDEYIVVRANGGVFINGEFFPIDDNTIPINNDNGLKLLNNWGKWNYGSETFRTGGKKTAIIAAIIASFAPWVPVRKAASIASVVAASYDELTIEFKIRYRTKGNLTCYERYTSFYGDKDILIDSFRDSRCSAQ